MFVCLHRYFFNTVVCDVTQHLICVPKSEGGPSTEQNRLGFGLGLFEKPEKGMILHTDLPEQLTAIAAGHQELKRVLVRTLLRG